MSFLPDVTAWGVGKIVDQGDYYNQFIPDFVTNAMDWFKENVTYESICQLALDMSFDDLAAIMSDPVGHLNGTRLFRGRQLFTTGALDRLNTDLKNFWTPEASTKEMLFAPFHNTVIMGKLILIGKAGTNELLARAGSNVRLSTNPMLGFDRALDGGNAWENGRRVSKADAPDWQATVRCRLYDVRNVWCAIFNGVDPGIVNPSFEAEWKADGVPFDWRYTPGLTVVAGTCTETMASAHGGTRAVQLTNTFTTGSAVTQMYAPFAVEPRSVFHTGVWVVSGRTPSSVQMQIDFLDGNGAVVDSVATSGDDWSLIGSVWTQMSLTATAPVDAVTGRLYLKLNAAATPEPAIFDDVSLVCVQQCDEPVIDLPSGAYPAGQGVRIDCPTMPATVRYTTDGTDPTTGSPYFGSLSPPITLSANVTIKARAWHAPNWQPSDVVSATYRIAAQPPTLSPGPGVYDATQTVSITSAVPGATIRYTTNGSLPTSVSPVYAGPVEVSSPTRLLARVFADGLEPSPTRGGQYDVFSTSVSVSPAGGAFTNFKTKITLDCGWPGAKIYYSTTGQLPTRTSARWLGTPIPLYHSEKFRARALINGTTWGPETSVDFLVNTSSPSFSPVAMRYSVPKTVKITYTTAGTKIYFTTDGSLPTTSSELYRAPIVIASTTTLKARALLGGTTWSSLKSGVYTIAYPAPYFSPIAGTYATARYVSIKHSVAGARIFYTTDGSTPTTTSLVYSSALFLDEPTTIKTRALFDETTWSATRTGYFNIKVPRPYFSPIGGIYTGPRTVTIKYVTVGAAIYYTTDGSEPSKWSKRYKAPFSIATTTTLKARALVGKTWSATKTATYKIRYATPSFSPAGGTYPTTRNVAITFPTSGASIYYTLDGSDPSVDSSRYASPVRVSETLTLKARALVGLSWSPIRSATYTIAYAAPTFVPGSGTYYGPHTIKVTYPATSATVKIYYTTDGSLPDTSSALYTSAGFSIDTTSTLRARALLNGKTWSASKSATIYIRYYAPAFGLLPGSYSTNRTVTITNSTPGVAIYYTTDGSEPTTLSTLYTAPVPIDATTTLRSRALVHGRVWTPEKSATYTINLTAPVISPAGGSYSTTRTVTITYSGTGATVYYTLDGSMPDAGDAPYTAPFSVDQTVTVQARALLAGGLWSGTRTVLFEIHFAAPVFVPSSAGPYSKPTTVTITSSTHGSAIYYTTDGSEPTTSSIRYTAPFSVDQTTTVKARELINGHVWGAAKTMLYKIAYAAPTLTPSSGTYAVGKTVTITHTVSGAQIYYTVNGGEPTTSSALYSSPVVLNAAGPVTLKARALIHGQVWSATKSGTYTITGGASITFAGLVGRLR
jgi:hypothetical protein